MSELSTARLRLRHWRAADTDAFAALSADPEVMHFMPACLSRSQSDAFAVRAQADLAQRGFGLWAAEARGQRPFIGYVGLSPVTFAAPFTPAVEIAWRLGRASWGCGYATEAAREVLRFAFEELGLHEIVAFTVPANVRSRALMQRLGLRYDVTGISSIRACPQGMHCAPTCSTGLPQGRGRPRAPERLGRVPRRNCGISRPAADSSTRSAARRARVCGRCALITHQVAARR
ncbi:MAG TPA: GNAT family N-acetyltransferase [Steroidobacteraceae bacterium]|jgi:RimJ/RimL family protein N-acetyltransferase|nr:GNAT family N-acetyltransferase [Steroidobacteraceae bacterium]